MDLAEKIKLVMIKQKMTQVELAEKTGQRQSNLSAKLKANDFKYSEYEKLVKALGCELEVWIKLPNGEKF